MGMAVFLFGLGIFFSFGFAVAALNGNSAFIGFVAAFSSFLGSGFLAKLSISERSE